MPSREQAATLAALVLGAILATGAGDLLRAPAWRAFEVLWVWWATDLSHYFGF